MRSVLLIVALLFSLTSFANYKVSVSNVHGKSFEAKFKTESEAKYWIEKQVKENSWGLSERWVLFDDQHNCLETKDNLILVDDEGLSYPDPIPEGYNHPQIEIVDYRECKLPKEFTVTISDITLEVQAEEKLKEDKKKEIRKLKAMINNLEKYDKVKEWRDKINMILKHILKDMKE